MANLASQAMPSRDNLLIDDHAAAHAGPERNHNQISAALAAALPHLAQRGHIGIISAFHGNSVQKL